MTISGLAREARVGVETVRFYQRRGLLDEPARSGGIGRGGGIRRYGGEHVRRLRFIRFAQDAGFSLAEISELVSLDATEDRIRARALATSRLIALDTKIGELERARDALRELARACDECLDAPCPIIDAFNRHSKALGA